MNTKTLEKIKEEVTNRIRSKCDSQHGITHLNNVRDSALEIAKHHRVNTNLLEAMCYLHDLTYTRYDPGVVTYFLEGTLVKKILPELLDKFNVSSEDRKIIVNACGNHPHSFPWARLNKSADIYSKILQDADTLDFFSISRLDNLFRTNFKLFNVVKKFLLHSQPQILGWFLNLETSKQILKRSYRNKLPQPSYLEWNKDCENTCVLLHGYADKAEMFSPVKDTIKDRRLIAVNLPMVHSGKKIYDIKHLAEYVKNVVDDLKIQDYSVIGFSLGGLVSLKITENNPKVKQIILMNSFPSLITNGVARNLYHLLKILILNKWFLFLYSKVSTNRDLRSIFKKPYISDTTKKYMKDNYVSVFGTLFNCIDFDGIKLFKQLKINKSIILVEDDEVIKLTKFLKAAKEKNFEVTLVSEGGHNSKKSYWDKMSPALSTILQEKSTSNQTANHANQIVL